jgi:hypothetical protein
LTFALSVYSFSFWPSNIASTHLFKVVLLLSWVAPSLLAPEPSSSHLPSRSFRGLPPLSPSPLFHCSRLLNHLEIHTHLPHVRYQLIPSCDADCKLIRSSGQLLISSWRLRYMGLIQGLSFAVGVYTVTNVRHQELFDRDRYAIYLHPGKSGASYHKCFNTNSPPESNRGLSVGLVGTSTKQHIHRHTSVS